MSKATEISVGRDGIASVPLVEVPPKRPDSPPWHSLRLFGRGRHAGAFVAGTETRSEF
jgi:hypothetical protein